MPHLLIYPRLLPPTIVLSWKKLMVNLGGRMLKLSRAGRLKIHLLMEDYKLGWWCWARGVQCSAPSGGSTVGQPIKQRPGIFRIQY